MFLIKHFYSESSPDLKQAVALTTLLHRSYVMGAGFVKRLVSCGTKSFRTRNRVMDNHEAEDGRIRVHVQDKHNSEDALCVELPMHYLSHPVLEKLLKDSGEEFGYRYDGALRICCNLDSFLAFVHLLNTGDPSAHYFQFQQ